jgi:UDP-3-O-acyl N-acetylglucosamine deacetylase
VCGIGFLTGADVRVRFLPADEHAGIKFLRTDIAGAEPIPALVEYTVPRLRRTAIERRGVAVELIEHAMAALAGLQIDNCLVEVNAPELPGLDGSCHPFVNALLDAGIVEQSAARKAIVIAQPDSACSDDGGQRISLCPSTTAALTIGYELDYGPNSPIPPQSHVVAVTPDSFVQEIAAARTFILDSEVRYLQAQGFGRRTTPRDLLVFGPEGVIDNSLRADNECARHKILDCIGDFALIGCDIVADVRAVRSGHRLNGELVRRLRRIQAQLFSTRDRQRAA